MMKGHFAELAEKADKAQAEDKRSEEQKIEEKIKKEGDWSLMELIKKDV